MQSPPTLRTRRLLLQALTLGDAAAIWMRLITREQWLAQRDRT